MHELSVFAAAEEVPSAECLIDHGRALSFAEVAGRTAAAVEALRALGVEAGEPVAVSPRQDVDSAVWLYALFELGCPAALLHPALTRPERSRLLEAAGIRHAPSIPLPSSSKHPPRPATHDRDSVLVIAYTSGSRGTPRGVRLSRRAFVASEAAHAANLGWRSDDRWLLAMPPAHVGGLSILTRSLIARRTVVLAPGPFDPFAAMRFMERHGVTLASVVPTMLRRLLDAEPSWTPAPELRAVLVGGAPFSDSLRRRAIERGVVAVATYGCTEACSQVATQSPTQAGKPGSGAPLDGIDVRIREGEIQLRGDVLMNGYLDEVETESPWTPDGWFRTGDLGAFLPDGQLEVRGRIDDLIITGGENVAPQEIEAWLETVPGILAACVFSLPDDEWGERVAAAIAADPSEYDAESLRTQMRAELAPHKRPKEVAVLDSLPLTRSGKIDRAAIRRRAHGMLRPI